MSSFKINPYIKFTKISSGEYIEVEQRYIKLREGKNKIMAFSYKAPIFETIDFERFFENTSSSEKIKVNIGGTGSFGANFRGIIDGKEKNFSKNIDHKILLLEEYKCPKKEELDNMKKSYSYFVKIVKK